MDEKVLLYALGLSLSIIAFFMKGILSRLNAIEVKVNQHETKIEVNKTNHDSLEKRIDEVNHSVKALTDKIDTLLIRITQNHA